MAICEYFSIRKGREMIVLAPTYWLGLWLERSPDVVRYIERLEIAAKVRVIQDTAVSQASVSALREMDRDAIGLKGIGTVLNGDVQLTLRESCNKVIHATTFGLVFENARSTVPRYNYSFWNGICQLSGEHSKRSWRVALDVYRWADALDYFLEELSGNVDW